MKDDAEDPALLERIPFERGMPRQELWSRIEGAAMDSKRRSLLGQWSLRVAALAAGALAWLALDAWIAPERDAAPPARQADHGAWLADAAVQLPPEVQLATLLVSQGVER